MKLQRWIVKKEFELPDNNRKNIPSRLPLFKGVENKQSLSKIEKKWKFPVLTTHIIRTNRPKKKNKVKTYIVGKGKMGSPKDTF